MEHNLYIAALSVVVAIIYSFVALDFARRSNRKTKSSRQLWLFSASITLGIGLWGMHFVAMMSVFLSLTSHHYLPDLLLCMLLSIGGANVAFYFAKRNLLVSAMIMGTSIIGLHYFGMMAIFPASAIHYDPVVYSLAASFAYLFSGLALYRYFKSDRPSFLSHFISSLLMAAAIAGLHYIAVKAMMMKSQHLFFMSQDPSMGSLAIIATAIVAVATLFISLLYMVGKWSDQQLKLKSALLKESNQQNHSLIELNPDGVYIINKDRKLTVVNHSLEKLTGYASEELIGRPYTFLLAHADPDQLESLFQRTLGGESLQAETRILKKDGSVFDVEMTNIPYCVDNEIRGIVGTLKDLTVVQKIRESEKLAVVGEMAAGVAHEIRNPLTTLKGFTQTMMNAPSSPEMKTYLTIMLDEIESINLITNEFIVLAKPHMTITKAIDVVPLIKQVTKHLNSRANLNNIMIHSKFLIESGRINGEENQIRKMLVNLLINAIESMPEGGNVTLTATTGDHRNLLLYIKDEGVGMSSAELQQLGRPFYTTKENGKGLGLMVSQKIIKNHHGSLRFKSTPGEGTTAEISLPALEEKIKEDDTPLIS
ncbi:PAS domain S-box-containing protein [Fictibacillus solisalsi]|uniref:histidine kinase n=1 Tax=Fictibacillus solisalsi TaxID=459525 RepID=A0A1G9Y1N3_9BACL|nr:ATP-binding protein [Fictibacillus solisalsi]SDN02365.1 PAS domain S-box-containing protein [Fictibacillus solisalsi]